jgi:hypothetical protein
LKVALTFLERIVYFGHRDALVVRSRDSRDCRSRTGKGVYGGGEQVGSLLSAEGSRSIARVLCFRRMLTGAMGPSRHCFGGSRRRIGKRGGVASSMTENQSLFKRIAERTSIGSHALARRAAGLSTTDAVRRRSESSDLGQGYREQPVRSATTPEDCDRTGRFVRRLSGMGWVGRRVSAASTPTPRVCPRGLPSAPGTGSLAHLRRPRGRRTADRQSYFGPNSC